MANHAYMVHSVLNPQTNMHDRSSMMNETYAPYIMASWEDNIYNRDMRQ